MERTENFFNSAIDAVVGFFVRMWNGFVSLLARVFPEDFALMIAIVLVLLAFFAIFRWIITKR